MNKDELIQIAELKARCNKWLIDVQELNYRRKMLMKQRRELLKEINSLEKKYTKGT